MFHRLAFAAALPLAACSGGAEPAGGNVRTGEVRAAPTSGEAWFAALERHCGRTFFGEVERSEPEGADRQFQGQALVAQVGPCSADEVRIAFAVGEDRSRTWILTRTGEGVRLKHDHRLPDGREDPVSRYGGESILSGTPDRQEFPADEETRTMFRREGLEASLPNVWAMEVLADGFVYELARPGRLFRVRFTPDG